MYSKEGKPFIRCCPKFITVPKTNYRQQIGIKKWDKESISKTTIGKKIIMKSPLQRAVRETERFREQMEGSLSLNKQPDETKKQLNA